MKFYGRPVCDPCWDKYNAEDQPSFILKKILRVTPDEEPKNLPAHVRTGHDEFDAERMKKHEESKPKEPVKRDWKAVMQRLKGRTG